MALEYTAEDIRRIEREYGNLKKGVAALDWVLDATMDRDWDCWPSLSWLLEIIAKVLDVIGGDLPRSPAAEAPTEEQIGRRDYRGPFNDLLCAMLAGQRLTRPLGKKARHLRFIFEELHAGVLELEDFLCEAAGRRVLVVAVAAPRKQRVKKAQPRGCVSAAPAPPLAA